MNKAILIGNLGADPELKSTQGGASVLKLRLATTTRYKDAQGAWKDQTEWHSVDVWGARAQALHGLLTKGSRICVEGEIRTRSWETNTGEKRYATSINASSVLLLDGKREASAEDDGRGPPPRRQQSEEGREPWE